MEALLGSSIGEFIGVTVALFGGAGFMCGQALALGWRPMWQLLPYGVLMALANRFFSYALFGGELLSLTGLVIDAAIICGAAAIAYAATRARRMVSQYPWLYRRKGLFGWEEVEPFG